MTDAAVVPGRSGACRAGSRTSFDNSDSVDDANSSFSAHSDPADAEPSCADLQFDMSVADESDQLLERMTRS